jgi:hypothetical protein
MKKAPRGALLVWCIVVFLLSGWPWAVWLIFGAAYAYRLQGRRNGRLLSTDPRQPAICGTQRVKQLPVVRYGPNAPQQDLRVLRNQHFRHPPR